MVGLDDPHFSWLPPTTWGVSANISRLLHLPRRALCQQTQTHSIPNHIHPLYNWPDCSKSSTCSCLQTMMGQLFCGLCALCGLFLLNIPSYIIVSRWRIYADLTFVKNNYATAVFKAKELRQKNTWFATFANSQEMCVNGLKWDYTNEKLLFITLDCLFQHWYRFLHSKCANFHSKCLNLHHQWLKLRRKCANYSSGST